VTNLIKCPCGHTLNRHDIMGCQGAHLANDCSCKMNAWLALDAAIAEVRRPGPPIYDLERETVFDKVERGDNAGIGARKQMAIGVESTIARCIAEALLDDSRA
jgi:hypothetical protein